MSEKADLSHFAKVPGCPAKVELQVGVVLFNKELAEDWLANKNVRNRPLGKGDVSKYALAMCCGEWELNGEPIILDVNGKLVNGQHRLAGLVEAAAQDEEIEIPMLVVAGVKPAAFDTMDQGRSRSLADALAVNKEHYAKELATAVRFLWQRLNSDKASSGKGLRTATAVDTLKKHQDLKGWVEFFSGENGLEIQTRNDENCDSRLSRLFSLPHAAALAYLMVGVADRDKVVEFWRGLAFGVDSDGTTVLANDDPRKRCRIVLLKSTNSEQKLTRDGKVAVVIKAWQAYLEDEKLNKLSATKGEFPRIGGLDVEAPEDEEGSEDAETPSDDSEAAEKPKAKAPKAKAKKAKKAKAEDASEAGDDSAE